MSPAETAELKRLIHWVWLQQRKALWEEREAQRRARALAECEGKAKFPNFHQASRAIHANTHASVRPYRCYTCGSYHLGGKPDFGVKRAA